MRTRLGGKGAWDRLPEPGQRCWDEVFRPPIARNYYILCPIALLLGYLTLGSLAEKPRARRWAVAILAAGAILHIGLAAQYLKLDPWADRRVAPKRAIEQKDYRILAERRPHVRY